MVRKVSWSSCLKVGMSLFTSLSLLIIADTGRCRNLEGTSTVRGSFRAWSCSTTTSYKPSRQSASLSLNVFLRLRNEGGICAWASSEILQDLSQTSTRSNISVCSADWFSSWQSRAKAMNVNCRQIQQQTFLITRHRPCFWVKLSQRPDQTRHLVWLAHVVRQLNAAQRHHAQNRLWPLNVTFLTTDSASDMYTGRTGTTLYKSSSPVNIITCL